MVTIKNYALGNWIKGDGEGNPLYNAINGNQIGTASSNGLDFSQMMNYSRKVGGPALRKMTFQERGLMLKKLALHLHSIKAKFYRSVPVSGELATRWTLLLPTRTAPRRTSATWAAARAVRALTSLWTLWCLRHALGTDFFAENTRQLFSRHFFQRA